MRAPLVLFLAFFLVSAPAGAVQPDERLADAAQEARARALSEGLRCLVCQNQSIDDSDAPLARDLRLLLRERIVAGDTDAQARDYLVSRYGDFILLKPPVNLSTAALWASPLLALGLGAGLVILALRARGRLRPAALTEEEKAALEKLMAAEPADGKS